MKHITSALAVVAGATCLSAAAQQSYLSTTVGTSAIRLPNLGQFAPACQEERRVYAAMSAGLSPNEHLVACWVDAKAWREVKNGRFVLTYPTIMITHAHALGSNWSVDSFKAFRTLAEQNLGKQFMKGEQTARVLLERENEALAKQGVPIERRTNQPKYLGMFDSSTISFSYVMERDTESLVAGKPVTIRETSAMTNFIFGGQLLLVAVSVEGAGHGAASQAKALSSQWIKAFHAANPKAFPRHRE